jgi:NTE family protein
MAGPGPYRQLLASIPAFAALDVEHLQTLYNACTLRVLAKGEFASIAGQNIGELSVVVSGRLVLSGAGAAEAGPGDLVEPQAFFRREPAQATAAALRETVLLTLSWDGLASAAQANPQLLKAFLSLLWPQQAEAGKAGARLSRLVIAPAGPQSHLDSVVKEALLAGLEGLGEIRLLSRQSFGAGLPGALPLDAPGFAHWLQEQELEFDLTVMVADETDSGYARDVIAEADEVLFIARGGEPSLSSLERHAIEARGAHNCRLILAPNETGRLPDAAQWLEPRRYRSIHIADFQSPGSVRLMCQALLGRGHTVAAASRGVYAATILGVLQAFEGHGKPAAYLAAAGSAVLPAGLLACGIKLPVIEAIFRELAKPALWKRAARTEAGLFDPGALDHFLAGALKGLETGAAARPFVAVTRSLSGGAPIIHRDGRLHGAVRAGIAPPGILPPLIADGGIILVSGENEIGALLDAAASLSASPLSFLHASPPPPGASPMSYRSLAEATRFRLTEPSIDRRLRLETVLGAGPASNVARAGTRSYAIPIPEGITPMDWPDWERLRDTAYRWASTELAEGAAG